MTKRTVLACVLGSLLGIAPNVQASESYLDDFLGFSAPNAASQEHNATSHAQIAPSIFDDVASGYRSEPAAPGVLDELAGFDPFLSEPSKETTKSVPQSIADSIYDPMIDLRS